MTDQTGLFGYAFHLTVSSVGWSILYIVSVFDQDYCLDSFESTKSHIIFFFSFFPERFQNSQRFNFQLLSSFLFSIYDLTGIKAAI